MEDQARPLAEANIFDPAFADEAGRINCEIEHPEYGRIPFTASPDDPEEHGRAIHARALAMKPAPYVPPDPAELLEQERAGMVCSRMQARIALHQAGLLDAVKAAVAEADPVVQIAWEDATEFRRASPTIAALAAALNLTDEQTDDLFRAAMQIEV